jgi:hypothetical protein
MYFNITKKKIQPRNKYFPHPIGYAKMNLRKGISPSPVKDKGDRVDK